jgi:hypothetical protein
MDQDGSAAPTKIGPQRLRQARFALNCQARAGYGPVIARPRASVVRGSLRASLHLCLWHTYGLQWKNQRFEVPRKMLAQVWPQPLWILRAQEV